MLLRTYISSVALRGDKGDVHRQSQGKSTCKFNKLLVKKRLSTNKGAHHTGSMTLQKCITG